MLRAIGDNVLVQLPDNETVTPGGIVLPSSVDKMVFCTVESIGGGFKDDPPPCDVGDSILISNYHDVNVVKDGQNKLAFIKFYDILAVEE